ncbi:MAG: PD-(D/E)XK nuclease family protein [Ruminococcus sp.]|nr:PD-(D/E)XK nuclease family protein [Ruminococcus sp.]
MNDIRLTDEQALKQFLLDIECLEELSPWTNKLNIFDVLKITRTEIRHSNMLSWLFDANENHGLGDKFISLFMHSLVSNNQIQSTQIFEYLLSDFYSFSVYREWKNIDLLLVSHKEKIVIAIENKVGSHEHDNQLCRYRNQIIQTFSDYQQLFIYLTPDGESPSDNVNWYIFTYCDIADILEQICENSNLNVDTNLLIQNYIAIIRRDIVEDKQLIEICNKIYNKHKQALDLIYDNIIVDESGIDKIISSVLQKLSQEGKVVYEKEWGNAFGTKRMYEALPSLDAPVSVWKTYDIYSYWFRYENEKFYLIFEISGVNIPDEQKSTMEKMINILKPNSSKNDFKFKRLWRTDWFDLSNASDFVVEAEKAIRQAVDEMLAMEDRLFAEL